MLKIFSDWMLVIKLSTPWSSNHVDFTFGIIFQFDCCARAFQIKFLGFGISFGVLRLGICPKSMILIGGENVDEKSL